MKKHSTRFLKIFLVIAWFNIDADAQVTQNLTANPQKVFFVLDDIQHFISAHSKLVDKQDTISVLQNDYIDKATLGLRLFIQKYGLTVNSLKRGIGKYPSLFDSVRYLPDLINNEIPFYRKLFSNYNRIYANVQFPPVYFLVGAYNGIGSSSEEGLLIEAEKWKSDQLRHGTLLIHELTHFQQVLLIGLEKYRAIYDQEKSLLALVLREGISEFFADLVTGRYTQEPAREYVLKNEKELWLKFKDEMFNKETGDWMWNKPKTPRQPNDIGYVFGARIVKAFYDNAADKAAAIKEILSVTDYPGFLKASKYAEKFN